MKKIILICCFFSVVIMSCSKDPDPVKKTVNELDTITNYTGLLFASEGKITLNFSHYFNTQPIVYGSQNYINNANDTLSISNLSYRISNIQLKDKLKNTWTDIGTYNLNQGEDDAFKYTVSISKVPAGLYDSIRFNLGVDSVANSTGEQIGALDPSLGMYWSWTSGYIFYRLEGRTRDLTTFSLDVGGNKNLVNKALDLTAFKVKNETNGIDVEIKMDLGKFFNTPNTYNLKVDTRNIHNANEPGLAKLVPNMNAMLLLQDVKLK